MDTIVYKLHNLKNYSAVVQSVQLLKDGKGKMSIPKDYESLQHKKFSTLWFNLKHDFYHIMTYNTSIKLPSSESKIAIMFDEHKDLIRFEFSIPKMFFGNNVIELIPPIQSKYNHTWTKKNIQGIAKFWLKTIRFIFKKIIYDLTSGTQTNIDLADVQVSRLDIAFNQIFPTQRDAQLYHDAQKQIKAKRVKDSRNVHYDTALTIQTQDYYFKIYHKGAEFGAVQRKNIIDNYNAFLNLKSDARFKRTYDLKSTEFKNQNVSIDEKNNFVNSYNNLDLLQDYADKILRYELGCRKKLMSYLYTYHLNKQFITGYRELMNLVYYITDREGHYELLTTCKVKYLDRTTLKMYDSKNLVPRIAIAEPIFFLPDNLEKEKLIYHQVIDETMINKLRKLHKTLRILKQQYNIKTFTEIKNYHKFFKREQSKEINFFLGEKKDDIDFSKIKTSDYDHDIKMNLINEPLPTRQKFTIELMCVIIGKFEQLFNQYQLEDMPTVQHVQRLTEDYNTQQKLLGKKGLNVNHMKLIFTHINNGYSLDQLRKQGNYDRSTIFRYRQKINEITGFEKTTNYVSDVETSQIMKDTKTLYKQHYTEMIHGNPLCSNFLSNCPTLLEI